MIRIMQLSNRHCRGWPCRPHSQQWILTSKATWWTSLHAFLAPQIASQLNPLLRPKYFASPERQYSTGSIEEVLIAPADMIPDVAARKGRTDRKQGAGSTVMTPSVKMRSKLTTKIPHFRVEIRDVAERRLVTAIELLSPTNKRSGRREYLRKRRLFLRSSAHLLEIDLHHQGRRIPLRDANPPGAYFVLLNRARKRAWTEVWPIAIDARLPTVSVPLLKGDADVPLNLQKAFTHVYEAGSFDIGVDYRKPPDVQLPAEELGWLDEHLRAAGLRN